MKYAHVVLGIIIGLIISYIVFRIPINPIKTISQAPVIKQFSNITEVHSSTGKFTNSLLECNTQEDQNPIQHLNISKFELNDFVNKILQNGKVGSISVYIRDLNNGPWIGINDDERFIGGSLLKLPLLISYMKLADSDPLILEKKILYRKQISSNDQYFSPDKQIEIGKTYTVNELLKYMIVYSDNNAAEILAAGLDQNDLDNTFAAVGLGKPNENEPYIVDVQTYAAFFRILYNVSYVSRTNSEKALDLLSQAEFSKGITDQLPKNIVVSHKFGIRTDGDLNQLHDCGIIYYPNHPYLLCVMTKKGNFDDLASAISNISRFVFDQVSKSSSQ